MPFSDKPLESGRNDAHGIEWAVYQDLDVDPDNHKAFTIIASRGTGRYIAPDVTCDSMDEFQAELDSCWRTEQSGSALDPSMIHGTAVSAASLR
jgi:hypothetical protein